MSDSATTDRKTKPVNFHQVIHTREPKKGLASLQPGRKRRSKEKRLYVCKICPSWEETHLGNTITHVKVKHPVSSMSSGTRPYANTQRSISSIYTPITATDTLRGSFNPQAYREALIGLLTRRRVPLSAVEWEELEQLCLACNPAIKDELITSRTTVVRYIAANHELYREQLSTSMTAAMSPIHISSDLWTSPHRHSMLAVCAQWVDRDYQLQKALLGLPELRDSHSGEQQAVYIMDTLRKYNIASQIGYHVGDNATSNDTCLEALSKQLKREYNVSCRFN
jgi:hypothetical protein